MQRPHWTSFFAGTSLALPTASQSMRCYFGFAECCRAIIVDLFYMNVHPPTALLAECASGFMADGAPPP
jgi:hypothetical protein